jgi:hypothetical protein
VKKNFKKLLFGNILGWCYKLQAQYNFKEKHIKQNILKSLSGDFLFSRSKKILPITKNTMYHHKMTTGTVYKT